MTAIGVVLIAIALLAVLVENNISVYFPVWLDRAIGLTFVGGVLLLLAGATTWLWRVMP